MFNISGKFRVMTTAGELEVNYPDDSHWDAFAKKHPRRVKHSGEVEFIPTSAFDERLFREIAGVDAPTIKPREATAIRQALDRCNVVEVETEGENFRLTAEVFGYVDVDTKEQERTVVTLREPSQAEIEAFLKRNDKTEPKDKVFVTTAFLKVYGELFDKIFVSSESYEGGKIPLNHKAAFVQKLINEINSAVDVQAVDPKA